MANLPVFAVCPRGFENILLEEIKYLTNQKNCQIKRGGVFFTVTLHLSINLIYGVGFHQGF